MKPDPPTPYLFGTFDKKKLANWISKNSQQPYLWANFKSIFQNSGYFDHLDPPPMLRLIPKFYRFFKASRRCYLNSSQLPRTLGLVFMVYHIKITPPFLTFDTRGVWCTLVGVGAVEMNIRYIDENSPLWLKLSTLIEHYHS